MEINFEFDLYFVTIIVILIIICVIKRKKVKNKKMLEKVSISYKDLKTLRLSSMCAKVYAECKRRQLPAVRFNLFTRPVILVADLKLLREIGNKWTCFRNRGSYHNETRNVFNMQDGEWHAWRKRLNHCFTLENFKNYLKVFDDYAQQALQLNHQQCRQSVDGFKLSSVYSYLVASHIFMSKSHESNLDFLNSKLEKCNKLFTPGYFNKFVDVFGYICPKLLRFCNVCDIPREVFVHLKQMCKEQIAIGNLKHDSFLHNLLDKDTDQKNDQLEEEDEIIGQLIGLFVGSLKSTTTFITHVCYELAKAPGQQDKLRQEIQNGGGELSYNNIQGLTYMQQVLDETLRLYTGGPLLIRECTESCSLGQEASMLQIDQGTLVIASLRAILTDEDYFAKAQVFDPERFGINSKSNQFLPFGLGKRVCIGNKFVLLQTKVLLIRLLSHYELTLDEEDKNTPLDTNLRLSDGQIFFRLKTL